MSRKELSPELELIARATSQEAKRLGALGGAIGSGATGGTALAGAVGGGIGGKRGASWGARHFWHEVVTESTLDVPAEPAVAHQAVKALFASEGDLTDELEPTRPAASDDLPFLAAIIRAGPGGFNPLVATAFVDPAGPDGSRISLRVVEAQGLIKDHTGEKEAGKLEQKLRSALGA
jgi:hypothetical protein